MNSHREKEHEHRHVVTAFLRRASKLLLVRRSTRVGTYRGLWSAISGYLERAPEEQALQEIIEETGLGKDDVTLVAEPNPFEVIDDTLGICWTIHPFLFEVKTSSSIRLDWENTEFRWVTASEVDSYPTVPALRDALARCLALARDSSQPDPCG